MKTRYLTKDLLIALNNKALRRGKNRTLYPAKLAGLDDSVLFPITESLIHNDSEIRCRVVMNANGSTAWLDMDVEDFNSLPEKVVV